MGSECKLARVDKKINSINKYFYKIKGGILADEMGLGKTITMLRITNI